MELPILLFSNGKEYTVTIDKNTTYRDLADKINEASGGEIVAKIVNTGEKGTPYRLTLTSKETGEDSAISFYAGKKMRRVSIKVIQRQKKYSKVLDGN